MARRTRTQQREPTSDEEQNLEAIGPDDLEEMDRDELLSLARRLVVERSKRGAGGREKKPPVDPDDVASSVAAALHYEPEPPQYTMSRDLGGHADRARADLEAKRWEDAVRGATGIIRGFAEGYDPGFDDEGMVMYDLHKAVEIADAALKHVKDDGPRRTVFDAMLDLWWADIGHGGLDLSKGVPEALQRQANKDERIRLAAWVKERLPQTSEPYGREAAALLFLGLGGDGLDDEAYLEFCRENGLHMERVERLVALGRAEEAARAANDVANHRLTDAVDLLVKAGHPALAVAAVRTRLDDPDARSFRDQLKAWLQKQAERGNDLAQARQLAWERFREQSSMETYGSLRRISRRTKSWPADEKEVLAQLQKQDDADLLTEVHLAERRVAKALDSLKGVRKEYPNDWGHHSLKRSVAHAAQKEFPEEARDLFLEVADDLIGRKTRTYYAQAAPLVQLAFALDARVAPEGARTRLPEELRRRYGGLPAFWDELRKAETKVAP